MKLSKEECRLEALKYTNKQDFKKHSSVAYYRALCNHWLPNIARHFTDVVHKEIYYEKEQCIEEALKYNVVSAFTSKSNSIYSFSKRVGILPELCTHMKKRKPDGFWTLEECHKTALKYDRLIDFRKKEKSAYSKCVANHWLPIICSHLDKIGEQKLPDSIAKKYNIDRKLIKKEECRTQALKYTKRSEFAKELPGLYDFAYKCNILDDICSHMIYTTTSEIKNNLYKKLKK